MKVVIFYNSRFGNGQAVASFMAEALNKKNHQAQAFSVQESQPKQIEPADLYVFSSSTHFGNAPFKTRRFLNRLKKKNKARYVLVTTNLTTQKSKTLDTMRQILAQKGYLELTKPLVLIVRGIKGPLEEHYQDKVKEYVEKIKI